MSANVDGVGGHLTWAATKLFGGPVFIDGRQLDKQLARGFLRAGAGAQIPLLSGTSLFQRIVPHPHAAEDTSPMNLTLTIHEKTVEGFFEVSRLSSRLFELWIELSEDVVFRLRPSGTGGEVRTEFTLPRPTGAGTVDTSSTGPYPPKAWLADFPVKGLETATPLTVIETGVPAAGEILIDAVTSSTIVTTSDLSAEPTGTRALVVRHYPIRFYWAPTLETSQTSADGVDHTFSMPEVVPAVEYPEVTL